MSNKVTIELVDEQLDAMILDALKSQYEDALTCTTWLDEDEQYNKEIAEHLKHVLMHNMTPDQKKEYFK